MWAPVVIFVLLVVLTVVAIELRERRRKRLNGDTNADEQRGKEDAATAATPARPEGCCGEHLVCEQETRLLKQTDPEYYDDEQLDGLADTDPATFSPEQYEAIREVFTTLREEDVAGWCRSLEMRRIQLPQDIRDEALLIVKERRNR